MIIDGKAGILLQRKGISILLADAQLQINARSDRQKKLFEALDLKILTVEFLKIDIPMEIGFLSSVAAYHLFLYLSERL